MIKQILLPAMIMIIVIFAGISAGADNVPINTPGTAPFLYQGQSYLPLRDVANFLGAPLRWDAEKGQAVLTYHEQELALTPNNARALFKGQPVVLTSPPVVVGGNTYLPTTALKQLYNVPVAWDKATSEVKIKGPNGWGTIKMNNRPPWHGGPPPWAPAVGERRKQHGAPGHQVQHNDEGKQKGKAKVQ